MTLLIGCFICACGKEDKIPSKLSMEDTEQITSIEETKSKEINTIEQWEKGYDLPVDEQEKEEAEIDCKKMLELIFDIYEYADKGEAVNAVLDNEIIIKMQKKVKKTNCPVTTMITYANMENYEDVNRFLEECMKGKSGSVVVYNLYNDGGLGRMKFIFDGTDMYVISTRGVWTSDNKPGIAYFFHTRIKLSYERYHRLFLVNLFPLFCKEEEKSDSVYIGEAENVQDRLIQHMRDYQADTFLIKI